MRKFIIKVFLLFVLLTSKNLFAHMYEHMGIEVLHPWATESDSKGNALAYLTISNNTNKELVLEKIITEVSNMTMFISNDELVNSIKIPANAIRSIDDFHIMFHNVKKELTEGHTINAKLEFSSGISMNIKLVIGENTSLEEAEESMDHKHHH